MRNLNDILMYEQTKLLLFVAIAFLAGIWTLFGRRWKFFKSMPLIAYVALTGGGAIFLWFDGSPLWSLFCVAVCVWCLYDLRQEIRKQKSSAKSQQESCKTTTNE
jgi:hypothetical protein